MLMPMLRFIYCFAFEIGLFLILVWVVCVFFCRRRRFFLLLLSFMCLSCIEFHWNMMMAPAPYRTTTMPNGRAANFREFNEKNWFTAHFETHTHTRTQEHSNTKSVQISNWQIYLLVSCGLAMLLCTRFEIGERERDGEGEINSIQVELCWFEFVLTAAAAEAVRCCCCCCFLLTLPSLDCFAHAMVSYDSRAQCYI